MLSSKYAAVCTAMAVITSSSAFSSSSTHHTNSRPTVIQQSSSSLDAATGTVELKNEGGQQCTLDGKNIRGPITPLGNFVLVRTKDTLSATDGGILLPDQAKER